MNFLKSKQSLKQRIKNIFFEKSYSLKGLALLLGVILFIPCFSIFSDNAISKTEIDVSAIHHHQEDNPLFHTITRGLQPTNAKIAACFAPDTDPAYIKAFYAKLNGQENISLNQGPTPSFELDDYWTRTATDISRPLGGPMTLTWGFVQDGTEMNSAAFEPKTDSELIAFLDDIFGSGGGETGAGTDYSTRPWFTYFEEAFAVWGELTGITYQYVTYDDGAKVSGSSATSGELNVRPDIRISGHYIDGRGNFLAYNYYPNGGDMVIDTWGSFSSANDYQGLRNVISHEHGHGIGLAHVNSYNRTILMQPYVSHLTGPQEDDILGGNRGYGDKFESNDNSNTATILGTIADAATIIRDSVSIDDETDVDYYSFTVTNAAVANITLSPIGTTYSVGPNGGEQSSFNALAQNNLTLQLLSTNGSTPIGTANNTGAGSNEVLNNQDLPAAGTYYVKVSGTTIDKVQRYKVNLTISRTGGGCPSSLVITSSNVSPGRYQTSGTLSTQNNTSIIVLGSTTVTFVAGTSITLNPGFTVEDNANFTAEIGTCSTILDTEQEAVSRSNTTNKGEEILSKNDKKNTLTIFPNPVTNSATIGFQLFTEGEVNLGLYNSTGQLLKIVLDRQVSAEGFHQHNLATSNMENGVYYLYMSTTEGVITKKIILTK